MNHMGNQSGRLRVTMMIRQLDVGGAERLLLNIVKHLDRTRFQLQVIVLRRGFLDAWAREHADVQFIILEKPGETRLRALVELVRALRDFKPDIVYTFLFLMNVVGALLKLGRVTSAKLIWTVLGSHVLPGKTSKWYVSLLLLQRALEPWADHVVSDSHEGIRYFQTKGFRLPSQRVIHSSADGKRFRRDPDWRRQFRKAHNMTEEQIAIGICSRLVPMKGYPILATAARRLLHERKNIRFFSAGTGQSDIEAECREILGQYGTHFTWLGNVEQPEQCLSGWDIYCSASVFGEGLSHAIVEAMACSLPCVVTETGDAPAVVGDSGIVVPVGDAAALYKGLVAMIDHPNRAELGRRARALFEAHLTTLAMVAKTERMFVEVAAKVRV